MVVFLRNNTTIHTVYCYTPRVTKNTMCHGDMAHADYNVPVTQNSDVHNVRYIIVTIALNTKVVPVSLV